MCCEAVLVKTIVPLWRNFFWNVIFSYVYIKICFATAKWGPSETLDFQLSVFKKKILFLVLSFQKPILLVYFFKDGLMLYVLKV